jgi:hypothetical protein
VKPPTDHFAWLGMTPRFALDASEFDRRQRELFVERAGEGPHTLEAINEALRLLKDPASRAEQLFRMRNWPTEGEPDPILLERVFADREFIDSARKRGDLAALYALLDAAAPRHRTLIAELTRILDGDGEATDEPKDPAEFGLDAARADRANAKRALLLLEELRYFTRAVAAAHEAILALER